MNHHRLSNIKIVLVRATHPGNMGATARAMKNMGLKNLSLVSPVNFPHADATARAAGADDVLEKAAIKSTVLETIEDCQLVIGTSARLRNLSLPLLDPKTCAELIFSKEKMQDKAAILFGTESAGLSNEDLLQCHYQLYIPTMPDFSSLNLGAAVQIITYELRMAFLRQNLLDEIGQPFLPRDPEDELASRGDVERFYEHFQKTLEAIDFLRPTHSQQVINRIKRLFNRAQLEIREVKILRGILSAIGKKK